jgi:cytochrome P450
MSSLVSHHDGGSAFYRQLERAEAVARAPRFRTRPREEPLMSEATEPTVFNPFAPGMAEDPYPTYTELRKQGPLHQVEGMQMYAAVGYDEVVQVLRERGGSHRYAEFQKMRVGPHAANERYCKGISEFVLMKEGDDHKRVRNAFIRAFTHERVDALRPEIERIAHSLIDAIEADGQAEIIEAFAMKLPLRTISRLLLVPEDQQDEIVKLMEGFAIGIGWLPMDDAALAKANAAIAGLEATFATLIAERRAALGDDLLSALIAEADAGNLTEAELLAQAWGLYAAGHETTGAELGNVIITLVDHPDQCAELIADRSLIPAAAEEIMRYRGLAQGPIRLFDHEIEIAGQTIPADTPIIPYVASANRDERKIENGDSFDIHRTQTLRQLSFSHGIHTCAGQHLAMSEIEIAIEVFFSRLRNVRIKEIDFNQNAIIFQGPRRMLIEWNT